VARIERVCRSVSETWNVMPMVNARQAKSSYRGGAMTRVGGVGWIRGRRTMRRGLRVLGLLRGPVLLRDGGDVPSATSGDVPAHVESGTPVPVLIPIASRVRFQQDGRSVGVAAHDEGPRDAVRLGAGELRADPLGGLGVTKDLGETVEGFLEDAAFVAPGANHAN